MDDSLRERGPDGGDDGVAARLRGFGPLGLLAIAIIVAGSVFGSPLIAALILLWAWRSRTPWREIGFVRPASWTRTVALGIVCGIALKFLMKAVVMPLFGADPINQAYHYLAGNAAALPGMLLLVIAGAGFSEEIIFRGYLFERLGKLFGAEWRAKAMIVLITSALFGAAHFSGQGLAGAEQATIVGLVSGTIFAVTGRIWFLMIMHAVFDLTAVAIIYWDVETRVSHLIFK